MADEDAELHSTLSQFDVAFSAEDSVLSDIENAIDRFASRPTGLGAEELGRIRRQVLDRLSPDMTVGALLKRRRTAMGLDLDDLATRARWHPDSLEDLEKDSADLYTVEARALGDLLFVLGLGGLGFLEMPLRRLASEHFAAYGSGTGPLLGRSRKGTSASARRRSLFKGVAEPDQAATERAVDMYLLEVNERLRVLASRRKVT